MYNNKIIYSEMFTQVKKDLKWTFWKLKIRLIWNENLIYIAIASTDFNKGHKISEWT